MDFSLIFTILLIFLCTSLVGFVRSRLTDRCLQSFQGFQVSLCRTDVRQVWGRLDLNPGGIEITFPQRGSGEPRVKSTYLLYAGEYNLIQSIFRHADRLTEAEQARRSADIARSFHPGPGRRLRRRLWNFLGTATDSLREVLALVVGRVQKTQDRYVAAEGTDALTKLGGSVLTEVSSIHDPLLERQIGRQVVVEVIEGDEIHEHVGIFKEYSSDFLHLLDVEFPEPWTLDIAAGRPTEHAGVAATREGDVLKVSNRGGRPVLVVAVDSGDDERSVDALVPPGGTIDVPLAATGDKTRLRIQTIRDLDMIVPRSRAAVRNRAERDGDAGGESLWDVVFDLGMAIRGGTNAEQEERLRLRLEQDPADATAAAALGAVLLKRQDDAEAGRWLRAAYNARGSLPDGGRRVLMQLRELSRRLSQRGHDGAGERPLQEP